MKFMVISNPQPARPQEIREGQTAYWDWIAAEKEAGRVKDVFVKAGRGAFVVFDVESHEELHRVMTEWSNRVPVEFTVYPLVDPAHQERIARANASS